MAWLAALFAVASPWKELGGIVSERLRWFHRFSLFMGFAVGEMLGRWCRESSAGRSRSYREWSNRVLWYGPSLFVAAMLVILKVQGGRLGETGVTLTGYLSYWAGLDAGRGFFPLMHGRPLRPDLGLPGRSRISLETGREGEGDPG